MKLKILLWFFCLFFYALPVTFAQFNTQCIDDATISINGQDGDLLLTCQGDGIADEFRFRTSQLSTPFGYALTDEAGNIVLIQISNTIDFDDVPPGSYRLYAFSFIGQITAEVGDNIFSDELASICYALTTNFIRIQPTVPDGGSVATEQGTTTVYTCPGDGVADIVTATNNSDGPQYAYIITDDTNNILDASTDADLNFDGAPAGVCRIWGLAYVGELTVDVGADINNTQLADECFDLSDNYITVVRSTPDGGTVSLDDGSDSFIGCEGAAGATILAFEQQTASQAPYTFVLTDENDEVLQVLTGTSLDLDDVPLGTSRLYGLSYTGDLLAAPGLDADTDDLSDDCFDLSDNFVEIVKRQLDAGTVSLASGDTEVTICVGDGVADEITATTTGSDEDEYTYVITDDNGTILDFSATGVIDFDGAGEGTCRIYGLAYSGNLTAVAGDNIDDVELSDECFQLSDNFITVTRLFPDGGTVSLASGATEIDICAGDGQADLLTIEADADNNTNYIFVITDDNNDILGFSEDGMIDFEGAGGGACRVWGLAYTGNLTAEMGDNAATTDLSDECFDLSDNFVTVNRTFVDGGTVSLDNGDQEISICANDPDAAVLNFTNTTSSNEDYTFVITTEDGEILGLSPNGEVDFSSAGEGVCLVWGLSFSGSLTAAAGDNALDVALSDECFELSENFVTVTRFVPEGGMVSLDGVTERDICAGDGIADPLNVTPVGNSGGDYIYVITDDNNNILGFSESSTIDLEGAGAGVCRIWGLAYTGNLTAEVGDNAATTDLSDGCFDLSDGFITINRTFVDGGTVNLDNGDSETSICANDPTAAILSFTNTTSSTENYAFVITTEDGEILGLSPDGNVDFSNAGEGVCLVWGLSYSGSLTAAVGDNALAVALSDDCFELSENFVTVTRFVPEGGTVSLDGATEVDICAGDGVADPLNVTTTNNSGGDYIYVITDDNNNILGFSESSTIDLDGAGAGVCRIWGLAYTGNLTAEIGDNAATTDLSDGCFDLSDGFITVNRTFVDGSIITLVNGGDSIQICSNDPNQASIAFFNSSASAENFIFVVVTEDGEIVGFSEDGNIDFFGVGTGVSLVYGISYSGNLTVAVGDNLFNTDLSDDCFDLADAPVTVTRADPEANTISLASGGTTGFACVGDGEPDVLEIVRDGPVSGVYLWLITDENNNILSITDVGTIDFEGAGEGICRIYGFAYTGDLLAEVGSNVGTDELATSCNDLSDNFITVERTEVDGGTVSLVSGETEITICANDPDEAVLDFTNVTSSSANYTFVITTEDGEILGLSADGTVDFAPAGEGVCLVWGLSYSGELTAEVGDNALQVDLSDACFELSENFVTVTRIVPEGGMVILDGGATDTAVCVGDNQPDVLSIFASGQSVGSYIFVITDDSNSILGFSEDGMVDFEEAGAGVCRVWGLSYTGTLLASSGDDVTTAQLAEGCFDLSDNFVSVTRTFVDGGTVNLESGGTDITICANDPAEALLNFVNNTSSSESYVFVVTTEDGEILGLSENGTVDFSEAGEGVCLVWGLSFSGLLLADAGDNALDTPLSDACFELSENFVTVTRIVPNGGTVSLTSGETETDVCVGDGVADVLTVVADGNSSGTYVYVVTTLDGEILALSEDGNVDFEAANAGVCLVWGLSYTGNLTATVGASALDSELSDGCFDLSDNFVTVNRSFVDGGTVSLADGSTEITICANDGIADVLTVSGTTQSSESYTFVITTDAGEILGFSETGEVDFEGAGAGVCLVWGLSYTGDITAAVGDNAAEVALSDGCFELSENVVTVTRNATESGTISLSSGATQTQVCVGDGLADVLSFEIDGNSEGNVVFIVTDSDGDILDFSETGEVDFEGAGAGVCLVWGLVYTGDLTAQPGDNIFAGPLADGCASLTDTSVTVNRIFVDGGMVSTEEGVQSTVICSDDETDILTLISDSDATENYTFLVTDFNNNLLFFLTGNVVDFNQAAPGTYRVWGLSYSGNLTAEISDNISSTPLSDQCFDLSDNFIDLSVELVDGGVISTDNGTTGIFICPGDINPDVISFDSTGISSGAYVYVVTDEDNNLLSILDGDSFDFNDAPIGTCQVWGLAYTGDLIIAEGDDVTTNPLSDECFDLTDNFITVVRSTPDGGTIATVTGDSIVYTCTSEGSGDNFTVSPMNDFTGPFLIVLTDDTNEIISTSESLSFNFDGFDSGTYRLYTVAYSGNFLGQPGDNLFSVFLSDDCFDVSDNFVTVIVDEVAGGMVSTEMGDTIVYTCPGDGNPDLIQFDSMETSNSQYAYIITDADDFVLGVLTDTDEFDFEGLLPGNCRVWGVAYTGTLLVSSQSNLMQTNLSDDCFDISDNFITVIREQPEAGNITSTAGQELTLCVGDGTPDEVVFEVTGASNSDYAYLITDSDGFLLTAILEDRFDFENASGGDCRIYGLAYTGELSAIPGDNVADVMLSTDCFDLTDDFIQLHRIGVDGSIVFSGAAVGDNVYVCAGDGVDDNVIFLNGSLATDGEYNYVVTTEDNVVLSVLSGNEQNFENTGFTRLRVFGVSFTGTLNLEFGDTITTTILSDGCYDLSENFLTVTMDLPEGGMVTTADGDTTTLVCPGATDGLLGVINTSTSASGYYYLITDTTNVILAVETSAEVDFNDLDPGFYRVWGVSFTGLITAQVGDTLPQVDLATSCFELSDNFVLVELGETVDPGIINDISGLDTIYTCPSNDMADLIVISTTSADTNYQYVITDTLGNLVIPDISGNVIDFDAAGPGIFRIYGIAYNGNFTGFFGQNVLTDALSDACAGASENFVTIVHLNPDGGTVSTEDGEVAISLVAGDGFADSTAFVAADATPTPYVFVVTNEANEVLAIMDDNIQDFEGAGTGVCRVWGLAYTNVLTVELGDTLTTATLSAGCFDLSDNFVEVTRLAPLVGGDDVRGRNSETSAVAVLPPTIRLKVAPNPANNFLDALYELSTPTQEPTIIQLVSATGQVLQTERVSSVLGANKHQLDITQLPAGMYLLYVRNGDSLQWTKFIKR